MGMDVDTCGPSIILGEGLHRCPNCLIELGTYLKTLKVKNIIINQINQNLISSNSIKILSHLIRLKVKNIINSHYLQYPFC